MTAVHVAEHGGLDLENSVELWSVDIDAAEQDAPEWREEDTLLVVDFAAAYTLLEAWKAYGGARRAYTTSCDVDDAGHDVVLAVWGPIDGSIAVHIELWHPVDSAHDTKDWWALADFPFHLEVSPAIVAPEHPEQTEVD